jgi:hypothetical protein
MPSARERQPTARGLRIGQSRGSEARGGGEEGGVLVGSGARLRKGTRGKITAMREIKGDAMCAHGMPAGHTMEEST